MKKVFAKVSNIQGKKSNGCEDSSIYKNWKSLDSKYGSN